MGHLSLIAHVEPYFKNSGLHLSISTIMFTECTVPSNFHSTKKDSGAIPPFSFGIDSFQVAIKSFIVLPRLSPVLSYFVAVFC